MRRSRAKHFPELDGRHRFFIYARKSTESEDRQVRSIGDQLSELRDLARKENLLVIDELVESKTAKIPGRPIFNQMVERVERGEATGVLAWHPDRLARNSVDGGRIIHLVDTGKIRDLKFPTFWFEPTSQGKFMLSIMFGQSKYYVDNLSENIRRGQRQKIKNGIWPMVGPVGYLNDRKTRVIYPDPVRAPLIRKAFELHAMGTFTIDRLMEAVNQLGLTNRRGKPLSRPQYHRLLQNTIYCGILKYGNESYEAKHEPIVPKELFDAVQEVMAQRSQPKGPELKQYLYRGLFTCGECGACITTETQKGRNYLRCTKRVKRNCTQAYVREEEIARQIGEVLQRVAIPDPSADWLLNELAKEQQHTTAARDEQRRIVETKYAECDRKLKRLLELHLDQNLTVDEYRDAKAKLLSEKLSIGDQLHGERGGDISPWFEPAMRLVKTLKQSHFMTILDGRTEEQRDFLKTTGSN